MSLDLTVAFLRNNQEIARLTVPAHTPIDTPIFVRHFSVEPLILNRGDILKCDVVSSDGSDDKTGVATILLMWRLQSVAKEAPDNVETFLLHNTDVGTDVSPHRFVTDGGTLYECVAISRKSISRDLTVAFLRNGQEIARITVPAHTPIDTPVFVQQFAVEPPILNRGDILTCNILSSDGSYDKNGVATILLMWRQQDGVAKPKTSRGSKTDRREAVDAYINEVFTRTGKRLTRSDIWKKAGDRSRTEFERWESYWYENQGKRGNKAAHQRFTSILKQKPHL